MSANHLANTLQLVRTTLEAIPEWVAVCSPRDADEQIVVGMAGHPYEMAFLSAGGVAQPLELPIAQIACGEPAWTPGGALRWTRAGSALIDVAVDADVTPGGYDAVLRLAEGILDGFRSAHDAGTLLCADLSMPGPPLLLPKAVAPAPFGGAWSFRVRVAWQINPPV